MVIAFAGALRQASVCQSRALIMCDVTEVPF